MQTDFKHVEYTIPHVMKYLHELNEIKGYRMRTREELKAEAEELVRHPQTKWHWIYDGPECEKNFRGFLAIGFRDNCHPLCDYFVAQTYTVPEYRRQALCGATSRSGRKCTEARRCACLLSTITRSRRSSGSRSCRQSVMSRCI